MLNTGCGVRTLRVFSNWRKISSINGCRLMHMRRPELWRPLSSRPPSAQTLESAPWYVSYLHGAGLLSSHFNPLTSDRTTLIRQMLVVLQEAD